VRVEFSPQDFRFGYNLRNYRFTLDEPEAPSWWDDETRWKAEEMCKVFIEEHTVRGDIRYLSWEKAPYILVDATVEEVAGRIFGAYGDTFIAHLCGPATYICGNTEIVNMLNCASAEVVAENSLIRRMWDTTCIKNLTDRARVKSMRKYSVIHAAEGHSRIEEMSEFSHIVDLADYATVEYLTDNATIEGMYDTSVVEEVNGRGIIHHQFGDSVIKLNKRQGD